MTVMPAAVKAARRGARPGKVRAFLDRQRIHVRTQTQGPAALSRAQYPHDSGSADPFMDLQPGGAEQFGDAGRSPHFLEAQFGVGMDVAPQGDQRVEKSLNVVHLILDSAPIILRTGSESGNDA